MRRYDIQVVCDDYRQGVFLYRKKRNKEAGYLFCLEGKERKSRDIRKS